MAVNTFTGATSNAWTTASNWSLGAIPLYNDGHVATFGAASPDCDTGAGIIYVNSLDFTAYTNTITIGNYIKCYGNLTFGTGMHVGGAGYIMLNAAMTVTTNGYAWPNDIATVAGAYTVTLADDFHILGSLNDNNGAASLNFAGDHDIYIGQNLTSQITTGGLQTTDTCKIILNGTGTLSSNNATIAHAGGFIIPIEINTTGTITLGTTVSIFGKLFKHIAGTVDVTTNNSTLKVISTLATGITTLDLSNITINNFRVDHYSTTADNYINLASNLTIAGNFYNSDSAGKTILASDVADTQRKLTLLQGGTCDLTLINATDIDSGDGLTIWCNRATLDNTLNWKNYLVLPNLSSTF